MHGQINEDSWSMSLSILYPFDILVFHCITISYTLVQNIFSKQRLHWKQWKRELKQYVLVSDMHENVVTVSS